MMQLLMATSASVAVGDPRTDTYSWLYYLWW